MMGAAQGQRPTVQRILEESFGDYDRAHPLPDHVLHAARRMRQCRTSALGYHRLECPNGHVIEAADTAPNSCRHRSCPQCRYLRSERWLERAAKRVIQCAHFHLVFTIAHELNPLWIHGSRVITRIFFAAVRDTLYEFLQDPEHLGALPGIILALQTWDMTLLRHLHIHCLVTAGGLAPDGTWRASGNFLLPVVAASEYFRGKFLAAVELAVTNGELVLPPELSSWPSVLRRLHRKKWNVFVQNRVANPRHVLDYLGRYICGGPIGNSRLVNITEHSVTFRHTRDKKDVPMTLDHDEFIGRLLLHVPIPGMQMVRSYGLYANNHPAIPSVPSDTGCDKEIVSKEWRAARCCPTCGAILVLTIVRPSAQRGPINARCRGSPQGEVTSLAA